MTVDYLIAGQGLAGTILSYVFRKHGRKVLVLDAKSLPCTTQAAAGVFNPLTGKKLLKTWKADTIFPFLLAFYPEMEIFLGANFFHPKSIYRPFQSIEEQNFFLSQTASPELHKYVIDPTTQPSHSDFVHNPLSGLETNFSGFVDVSTLLSSYRDNLLQNGLLIEQNLEISDLLVHGDSVQWQDIHARRVIFCEGPHAIHNPFFNWLPLRHVKGEVLTVEIEAEVPDYIFKQGVFILPVEQRTARVGATYEWHQLDWQPTEKARQELTGKLEQMLRPAYRVIEQKAGLRPTTPDRRPFIGLHPELAGVGIFNGLGSKGISLAPYFAERFFEFLEYGQELDSEVNINRYFTLYYNNKKK